MYYHILQLVATVQSLNIDPSVHGMIVQVINFHFLFSSHVVFIPMNYFMTWFFHSAPTWLSEWDWCGSCLEHHWSCQRCRWVSFYHWCETPECSLSVANVSEYDLVTFRISELWWLLVIQYFLVITLGPWCMDQTHTTCTTHLQYEVAWGNYRHSLEGQYQFTRSGFQALIAIMELLILQKLLFVIIILLFIDLCSPNCTFCILGCILDYMYFQISTFLSSWVGDLLFWELVAIWWIHYVT